MSESLSKSFSNLKVIRSRLLIGLATNILKKVTAPPKFQVAFPNRRDGRICYYGYDVCRKWLIEYATAHWCWGPLDSGCYDDASKASGAIKILRTRSGIDLNFQTALTDPSINAVTIPGHRLGEVMVPIISIFSDSDGLSLRKWPTQAQVDRLSEILGKQPRWCADYEDRRMYGQN